MNSATCFLLANGGGRFEAGGVFAAASVSFSIFFFMVVCSLVEPATSKKRESAGRFFATIFPSCALALRFYYSNAGVGTSSTTCAYQVSAVISTTERRGSRCELSRPAANLRYSRSQT